MDPPGRRTLVHNTQVSIVSPVSSIHNFCKIVITFQICKNVIWFPTVQITKTGVNPHDVPGDPRPIWAIKLDLNSLGFVWRTASVVRAHATILGSVRFLTHTARNSEIFWFRFLVDRQTFFTRPEMLYYVHFTGSQVTETTFLEELTLGIIIGYPCRYSHPARPGTRAPRSGLNDTIIVPRFSLPTVHWRSNVPWRGFSQHLQIITYPLFTTSSSNFNTLGVLTPHQRGAGFAERDAAYIPIQTGAVEFAVWLKALAIDVPHTVQETSYSSHLSTDTYFVPRHVPAVVTV